MSKLELVKKVPILYAFATASSVKPNETAQNIIKVVNESNDPFTTATETFGLLEIHKTGRKKPIGWDPNFLKNAKGNYTCICPFHGDNNEGSLVIAPGKNYWKCFACGEGGDIIDFETKFFKLGFRDALNHAASRFGFDGKSDIEVKETVSVTKSSNSAIPEMKLASKYVINNVYRAMQEVFPLTEAHKKHLLNVRQLTKNDFKSYFSFPQRGTDVAGKVMECLKNKIAENTFEESYDKLSEAQKEVIDSSKALKRVREDFKHIPGFYLNKSTNKIEWMYKTGIALLAIDDLGYAQGIQVQNLNPTNGAPKYVWWSSQSKLGEPNCEGGSSAGAPGGVVFPKDPYGIHGELDALKAPIVITEGRYKAEALARQGQIAVYVSGVSTWRNIIPIIERLRRDRENIYVAFDSDSMGNTAVFTQLKELSTALEEMNLKPIILTWSKSLGKGFDDLLFNEGFTGYKKFMKAVSFKEFVKIFYHEEKALLKKFGAEHVSSLDKKYRNEFKNALQSNIEQTLNLFGRKN